MFKALLTSEPWSCVTFLERHQSFEWVPLHKNLSKKVHVLNFGTEPRHVWPLPAFGVPLIMAPHRCFSAFTEMRAEMRVSAMPRCEQGLTGHCLITLHMLATFTLYWTGSCSIYNIIALYCTFKRGLSPLWQLSSYRHSRAARFWIKWESQFLCLEQKSRFWA